MNNDKTQVAKTILQQLGGRRFMVMTGSKQPVAGENFLMLKLARNKSGANKLKVTLKKNDTYKVEFMRVSFGPKTGPKCTDKGTFDGVYFDQLQDIFEETTGLYTTLHQRK